MAKKQTSSRISTQAARLLAKLPRRGFCWVYKTDGAASMWHCEVSVATLRSICASALSQDETKGQLTRGLSNAKHDQEGAAILRCLGTSADFDGSASRALRRWKAKDTKLAHAYGEKLRAERVSKQAAGYAEIIAGKAKKSRRGRK